MKKIEILAPAGSFESVVSAVNSGADAVYLGLKNFSARKEAENFTVDELKSATSFCHIRGVKVYVTMNTLIFDEVDTGVSGRAAQKVAEKLKSVARTKQVLCVTHLPQLAAMGDTHLLIAKGERNGRTYTTVTPLDLEGRKRELARIIGGANITETTLKSAEEMLRT